MFKFKASGSSISKPDYVPSPLIAQKVAEQEEERRRRDPSYRPEPPHWEHTSKVTSEQKRADDVLAPGFMSGPLGYEEAWQRRSVVLPPLPSGTNDALAPRFQQPDLSTGFSSNSIGAGNSSAAVARSTVSMDLSSTVAGPLSISTTAANAGPTREDVRPRSSSIRFSSVAQELNVSRPMTPAVFTQNSVNPFFSGNTSGPLSTNNGAANLQSALKDHTVDVLKHRSVGAEQALNSSLGPALGSVAGTSSSMQPYGAPRSMDARSNAVSGVGTSSGANSGATGGLVATTSASPFLMSLDQARQAKNAPPMVYDKNLRDDDEEEKDKKRFMPPVLMNSTSGWKVGTMDSRAGKAGWDSVPFQPAEPSKDGASRLPPHLSGEDAPPIDTLFDIARKEKLYSQPLTNVFNPDARPDMDMRESTLSEDGRSSVEAEEKVCDSIIAYGFPEEIASAMMQEFSFFGAIARFETGYYGRADAESFNYLKIKFREASAARRAASRHLKAIGPSVVGVHFCPSFSEWGTRSVANNLLAGQAVGLAQSIARDLSEAETREVLAGVDSLLKLRAQGGAAQGPEQAVAASLHQSRGQHAQTDTLSLSFRQSGGGSTETALAEARKSFRQSRSGFGLQDDDDATTTMSMLNKSGSGFGFEKSVAMDEDGDDDDEMAYILGHSLTSGGSIARTREREEFRRSRSMARSRHLMQEEVMEGQQTRVGPDRGILAEPRPGSAASASFGGQSQQQQQQQEQYQQQQEQQQYQQQYQQQQLQQYQQQQQQARELGQSRYTLARPSFMAAASSNDNSLFSASAGVLRDESVAATAGRGLSFGSSSWASGSRRSGNDATTEAAFNHVQKRQRLEVGAAPRTTASSSSLNLATTTTTTATTMGYGEDGVPLSEFGKGRDRTSVLINDPSKADRWGAPLPREGAGGVGGVGAGNNADGSSVISSLFTMAKKRLFWG
ncbi:hypothetical protein BGZ98_007687 [Dissophora globulifera]|nr:hypothetical protein BGZ98_007687 [Dissophora globulifera]